MEYDIEVKGLYKSFRKPLPGKGIRRLFPKKVRIKAVNNVSFCLAKGEFVAYVGANGSGKSTTIKVLTGILIPDKGYVSCLGKVPWKQRISYTKDIGVVFGQKSLLWPDLPALETFKLYKDIYEISDKDFDERLDLYERMLGIRKLMDTPVRKMSFGERMRCELAASLLHKPKLLFLDEPTVGMDVVAKEEIRNFLKQVNEKERVTILLTTHDMSDVEALCKRIILIDKGQIIYDGDLNRLKRKYVKKRNISVVYSKIKKNRLFADLMSRGEVLKQEKGVLMLSVEHKQNRLREMVDDLIEAVDVLDISIEEPGLAEIVSKIYKEGKVI